MTTETPGALPRRTFLAAMTAAGVVAGGGLGLVFGAASSAVAATGPSTSWHITSEPADARQGYAQLINAIKQSISDHTVRPEGGRPVLVTTQGGTGTYTTVDLYAEDSNRFIRVFMRQSDAYVMGWRPGTENVPNSIDDVTWGSFFPLEEGVQLPGATAGNTNTRYNTLATYDALRAQGAPRDNMQISPASLSNAVLVLHDGASSGNGYISRVAPAILQIIVALAEGSRFRNQAAATATAFGNGVAYTLTPEHQEQHNNWGVASAALLGALLVGAAVLAAPVVIAGIEYETAVAIAGLLMLAHHSDKNTKGKGLLEEETVLVAPDGTGDYWTVQAAINAAPNSGACTIFVDKGVYHEVISVPKDKSWLTIQGVSGNRSDIVIYNTRCHGMINPATGQKWGTQGSAVATFRPPNLTVKDLTISNTFDRNAHPEISPYETQAVAVAAMGDRQVYDNVAIMSHQDTLLVKGETPTTEARQLFVNCFIRGDVDFIFGNATAVVALSTIQVLPWPNGTVLAPNTDGTKKYGILLTSCTITTNGVQNDTMHLGRPWNNTEDAWPQAIVRNCEIQAGIKDAQPWTDMLPDEPWRLFGRFASYQNFGPGAGTGPDSPQLTDAEAADYTGKQYLLGSDGWDPFGA